METFRAGERVATGYLARPSTTSGKGVLVLHPWWGLNEFIKELCDRLAGEGFVAFAPDLYDGRTATTITQAEQLSSTLDFEATIPVVLGGVDYLRGQTAVPDTKIGVIGLSMGAAWTLWLATESRPDDVTAVVLFYGNWPGFSREKFAKTEAAFLGHFAANDPYEEPEGIEETRREIEEARREVTFHTYPETGHWFFESNRPDAYHQAAAALAWERTVTFLKNRLNR
ncbi:MAG: dienelactone hydrolase [Chloroflexota bacterium]|nr:dienelactone hydrolase family protein [Ardenticatenaceae bacterium]MBL1126980.1 dienelactone hydrolase family protein [Chloroflexota bacterium]GIK54663.1 MAG: dienelactone hydrolase [Chloroflexota bacterium]